MHDDPFERLILRHTDDPALLARTADRLGRHCHASVFLALDPSVAPPAKWVRSVQKGPVALAAWAARYSDDPDALRAVYATANLRKTVLDALCENPFLPDDTRAQIAHTHRGEPDIMRRLAGSMSPAAQVAAYISDDRTSGVTPRLMDRQVTKGVFDDDQVATLAAAYLSWGDWTRTVALAANARDSVVRIVTDSLFAFYDWGYGPTSPLVTDTAHAAALAMQPGVDDDRRPNADLAVAMLRDLPLADDAQFARVAAVAVEAAKIDSALGAATTRTRLEIILDLTPPNVYISYLSTAAVTLFTDSSTTRTTPDPLLTRLLARCRPGALPPVLAGLWADDRYDATARVLPDDTLAESMVRRILDVNDRETTVRLCYTAITDGDVPDDYRDTLLDKIPGLAHRIVTWDGDRETGGALACAGEWIWFRLSVATDRVDLALDQLRSQPTATLDEVCSVASKLTKIAASD